MHPHNGSGHSGVSSGEPGPLRALHALNAWIRSVKEKTHINTVTIFLYNTIDNLTKYVLYYSNNISVFGGGY